MYMKNNLLKYLSSIFVCIILICSFVGCSEQNDIQNDTDTDVVTENVQIDIPDDAIDLSKYTLVRSASSSADVVRISSQFSEYLDENCGVNVPVKTDKNSNSAKEILIGKTSRSESKAVYEGLKERDWSVSISDERIVVAAGSDSLLYMALDWIKDNCLEQGKPYAIMGEGTSFAYTYPISTLTVGGTPIEQIKIAYSAFDNISYTDAAYMLAYDIMDRMGIPVEVGLYKENSSQKQILVGSVISAGKYLPNDVSVGADQYVVTESDGDILIIADTSIGAELGVQKLIGALREDTDGAVELTELCSKEVKTVNLTVDKLELADGASLRMMTFNIWRVTYDGDDPIQEDSARIENAKDTIRYYSPDVVGFQEYCQVFTAELTTWLTENGYTVLGNELVKYTDDARTFYDESQNYTPIAFKSDKFELVASGWQRLTGTYDRKHTETSYYPGHNITWGILKVKSTGKTFGVSSTHYFHGGVWEKAPEIRAQNSEELVALIKNLTSEYNCSFVALGDLNSISATEAYGVLQGSGVVTDARGVAQKEFSSRGAYHDYGSLVPASIANTIDHMFVTSGIEVIRHKTAINKMTANAADHYPVFIDFDLADISYDGYNLNDIEKVSSNDTSISRVPYRG